MKDATALTLSEFTGMLSAEPGVQIEPDQVGVVTTFDELGLDSLARLGVISRLERTWQIELADAVGTQTVGEFLAVVNQTIQKAV